MSLIMTFTTWSWRQRLLIALSWMQKGTVQAALGTVALDAVTASGFGEVSVDLGNKVQHLCVLTAFITSSLGHFLLDVLGTKLIKTN